MLTSLVLKPLPLTDCGFVSVATPSSRLISVKEMFFREEKNVQTISEPAIAQN
jgi:hypothetical protein